MVTQFYKQINNTLCGLITTDLATIITMPVDANTAHSPFGQSAF